MITILQRPQGFVLSSTPINGAVTKDLADVGKVLVTSIAHGLAESDVVYIKSNIEDYNGFYQINYRTADTFRIYLTAITKMLWVQDIPIVFYKNIGSCNWSCVHLPIVYKLLSDKAPTNYLDSKVTISSYSNDAGYVRLVLSGALAGTVNDLDYIKLVGATSPGIDGVYQIMEANSTSDLTISLSYDSYVFGSATVQRQYNNYHVVINVYAGLNASHFWAAKKPYELAGTLRIIPSTDSALTGASLGDNEVKVSINEILKGYIQTKNNLLLGTLPNNLDASIGFYIETFESYDVGTGYSFINFRSAAVSDQSNFEGFAVNAKLPFKNIQSGYLSEYIMTNTLGKFLTLFALPVMFAGCADKDDCYFDVCFVNPNSNFNVDTLIYLRQAYYKNGIFQSTKDKLISNYTEGIYRAQPDNPSCNNDRVDLSIIGNYKDEIDTHNNQQDYSRFNQLAGSGTWLQDIPNYGNHTISLNLGVGTSRKVYFPWFVPAGTHQIAGSIVSNSTGTINAYFLDKNLNVIATGPTPTPLFTGVMSALMTTTQQIYYIAIDVVITVSSPILGHDLTMNVVSDLQGPYTFSETKQVTINCNCNQQNIRLTWLNYLGGFDYWMFTTMKDYLIDITQTAETKQNIFPAWPKSYGSDADTIRKQMSRQSTNQIAIHSQNINEDELQAIEYIKTSPLVQIINSRTDRRTVIVDKNSFKVYTDADKLHTIDMILTFTDDIPSQSV
jgi:hypothetical protein